MSKLESAYFGILYCLTGKKEQLYSTAFLLPLALTFKGIVLYTFNALVEFAEVAGILLYADNGLSSVIKSIGLAFRFLSLKIVLEQAARQRLERPSTPHLGFSNPRGVLPSKV
jgi:hypothetical protein